jgi:hypothetical protein
MFVQGLTFVLRLNFCAKNLRLRKAAKRYLQFKTYSTSPKDEKLKKANSFATEF